ncbi:hypothetical protein [Chitinimonas sp. BJB300]|nr:hypothetical protein [Chitinimonas sp. BJB300]
MAALIERCRQSPGAMLIQFVDDEGSQQVIDANAVNAICVK